MAAIDMKEMATLANKARLHGYHSKTVNMADLAVDHTKIVLPNLKTVEHSTGDYHEVSDVVNACVVVYLKESLSIKWALL